MIEYLPLVGLAIGVPLGLLWELLWKRHDELMAKRASCYHDWNEPEQLAGMGGSRYKFRHCKLCGEQQNQRPDGSWPAG